MRVRSRHSSWEAAMFLEVNRASKAVGARDVLSNVTFRLGPGERVGLVGRNGCGKTTLLAITAGLLDPDSGSVRRSPPSLYVGYLPQAIRLAGARTVRDEVASLPIDDARWWHAERILSGLGIERAQWDQSVMSLSGGEKTRLSLAKLLMTQPDVLLLDEPTNHLDIGMLEWLEDWTSRRIIWTSPRVSGSKPRSKGIEGRSCSCPTTAICSTGSPRARSCSRTGRRRSIQGTSPTCAKSEQRAMPTERDRIRNPLTLLRLPPSLLPWTRELTECSPRRRLRESARGGAVRCDGSFVALWCSSAPASRSP